MAESVLEIMKFNDNMGDLSNKTFKEIFTDNKPFVEFTVKSMREGKGIFQQWIRYVKIKQNNGFSKDICESTE
jgi:hypothetical protein